MKLTKEQIQYIDNRLKKEGIKYWDIRIEMIDHVVSDLEKNAKTSDFKIELDVTLKRIGWSGSLSHINRESWQNVNIKYRREYHKGFVHFFKKFKNVSMLVISLFVFYVVSHIGFVFTIYAPNGYMGNGFCHAISSIDLCRFCL